MPNKYPYTASSGPLVSTLEQLRKSFPSKVSAETLQKWGLAPKNESYVINVLKFLGLIDDEGNKNPEAAKVFLDSTDEGFTHGIEGLIKKAYPDVFEHFGTDAWKIPTGKLTTFFRTADESTETVGKRKAGTFITLAGLAKKREVNGLASKRQGRTVTPVGSNQMQRQKAEKSTKKENAPSSQLPNNGRPDVGLTVRIEINLPASNDEAVYDSIFRSIRKNLVNVE